MTAPRPCQGPGCNDVLVRRPKEKPSTFLTRRFCSIQCRAEAQRNPAAEKPCAYCNRPCRRRPTESPKHWGERRFCSVSCSRRADSPPLDARVCGGCGTTFHHRPGIERRSEFLARKACSKRCADQLAGQRRAAVVPPKTCEFCHGEFVRKRASETVNQFGRRRFCSPMCSNLSRTSVPAGTGVPQVKTCERCNTEFARPDRHGPKRWLARRFCSSVCAGGTAASTPRRKTRSKPVAAPPKDVPRTVWRPATWGGPVVVEPAPAVGVEVLDAAV